MNITFLIGNGFDISCGMKSRYSQIYEEYCASEKPNNQLLEHFRKDIQVWGDFEMDLAKHANMFSSEKEFLLCLRDFQKFINKYLLKEQQRCKQELYYPQQHIQAVLDEFARSLSDFYKGSTRKIATQIERNLFSQKVQYRFITFNYTSLLAQLQHDSISHFRDKVNFDFEMYPPINVHGQLGDDIVLGIDNINQLSHMQYSLSSKGRRSIIKPFFNSVYDPERVENSQKIISESDIICIYGMSLGDSDLTWRDSIVNWLKGNEHHILFLYNYECSKLTNLTTGERLDIEDEEKEKFLLRCGISENEMDTLLEQIYIPIGKSIFDFQHVTYTVTVGVDVPHPPLWMC